MMDGEKSPKIEYQSVKHRYMTDAHFKMFVDVLENLIHQAQYTPSEIREAAIMAATNYEMHNTRRRTFRMKDGEMSVEEIEFYEEPMTLRDHLMQVLASEPTDSEDLDGLVIATAMEIGGKGDVARRCVRSTIMDILREELARHRNRRDGSDATDRNQRGREERRRLAGGAKTGEGPPTPPRGGWPYGSDIDPATIEAELDAIKAEPLTEEQVERIMANVRKMGESEPD